MPRFGAEIGPDFTNLFVLIQKCGLEFVQLLKLLGCKLNVVDLFYLWWLACLSLEKTLYGLENVLLPMCFGF